MFSKVLDSVLPRREAYQYKDDMTFLVETRQRLKNKYGGVGLSLTIEGNKVQQMINEIIRSSNISTLIEQREVTDKTFLSDVLKETKNKKARTALVKNKVRQIIEEKAHLNPVYYEKMKERLEAIIREEREERKEDADYFNRFAAAVWALPGQDTLIADTINIIMKETNSKPPPPGTPGPFSLSDENNLKNSFMKSGFKDLNVERMNVSFDFDSPKDYTTFTSETIGPLHKMLASQTDERRREILKTVTEAAGKYTDNNTVSFKNEAILIVGKK
jgi:hypothetical protein